MTTFTALLDGRPGAYGVAFPDAAGCCAMGSTKEEALQNAAVALAEWLEYAEADGSGRPVPRTAEELRRDAEVVEQLAGGSELVEVAAV